MRIPAFYISAEEIRTLLSTGSILFKCSKPLTVGQKIELFTQNISVLSIVNQVEDYNKFIVTSQVTLFFAERT